ncbi:hypothetical protein [Humibacillus xanthopallidus]|nr:hypothetical protein [Humibacillus xanthopallidus]
MINIDLPLEIVQQILEALPEGQVKGFAEGFSVTFADGVVAYGSDAEPDAGTDIVVKGPAATRQWQLYRHLESESPNDVVLWMMNDGAVFVAGRGTTAAELGL